MKKIYNMPDVTITCVELQQMIATSNPEDGFNKTDPSRELEGGISGGNMSHHNSIWDEEEAEEY